MQVQDEIQDQEHEPEHGVVVSKPVIAILGAGLAVAAIGLGVFAFAGSSMDDEENYVDPASIELDDLDSDGDLRNGIQPPVETDAVVYLLEDLGTHDDPSSPTSALLERLDDLPYVNGVTFSPTGEVFGFVPDARAIAIDASILVDLADPSDAGRLTADIADLEGVAGVGVFAG